MCFITRIIFQQKHVCNIQGVQKYDGHIQKDDNGNQEDEKMP